MKIKVFTTDQKGYITLTQKELQELLNEAYWEGYNEGNRPIPTYPNRPNPYYWTKLQIDPSIKVPNRIINPTYDKIIDIISKVEE